jgi:uncharacterized protein (DUF2141 family)
MILAAIFSVIFSCARQAAPTGGSRDITPPKIIRSMPPAGSRNFKGKKIVIGFDEYIVPDKMSEKFMVSPPVKKKPNIVLRGKNLDIEFLETLRDSTTYTLYFQDAIKDLNEENRIPDFQFVFSTGNVLDSLSVTGNIYNSSNLEVPEKTLVLMHRQMADSAPVKLFPEYLTLTDINGGFRINNIKGGTYRLYALQDKNNDKKYDFSEEGFAFMNAPILIDPTNNYLPVVIKKDTTRIKPPAKNTGRINPALKKTPEVPLFDGKYKLLMFTAQKKKHYLSSSGRKPAYHLSYILSLPPDSSGFEFNIPDAPPNSYFVEKNSGADTIDVWLTDSLLYSRQQIPVLAGYPYTDSAGFTKIKTDTIQMRFTPPRVIKGKAARNKLVFTTNIPGNSIKPGQQIMFFSETPFRKPDTAKIHLYESIKKERKPVTYIITGDGLNSRQYSLKAKFKEGSSYQLIAEEGSFSDIYNDIADSTGFQFSVRTPDSFGKLTININNVTGNIIVQLLDEKEKVVSEKHIKKDGKLEFPFLERGKYRLRAINDLNGDGKWTTGDFKSGRQPEPVTYFPIEIEIRINFEIEQQEPWDLSKWNQKDQKLRSKIEQNR